MIRGPAFLNATFGALLLSSPFCNLSARASAQADSVAQAYVYPEGWFASRYGLSLASNDPLWHDTRLKALLNRLARKIETAMKLPRGFGLVDVRACSISTVTAYSGGWIKVCLQHAINAETEDELAFVIAHELAHIAFDDVNKDKIKSRGRPVDDPEMERRADLKSLEIIVQLGYSPDGSLLFFEKAMDQTAASADVWALRDRQHYVQRAIAAFYSSQAESRDVAVLTDDYIAASSEAVSYLTAVEILFAAHIDDQKSANRAPTSGEGDGIRGRSCIRFYDGLNTIADNQGFSELLIHAAASSYYTCMFYKGINQRYGALVKRHVAFDKVDSNTLAAILFSYFVTIQNGFKVKIAQELKRRIFSEPPSVPDLRQDLAERYRRAYTQANLITACGFVGGYDDDEVGRLVYGWTRVEQNWLKQRAGWANVYNLWMSGCREQHDFMARQRQKSYSRIFEARRALGESDDRASAIAENFSRVDLVGQYVNGRIGLNRVIKLDQDALKARGERQK